MRCTSLGALALALALGGCGQDAETPDIPAYVGPPILSNVLVNRDPGRAPQNETTIAIDPSDRRRLVGGWNDYRSRSVGVGYGVSEDGGQTWTDALILEPDNPEQGDPALAASRSGDFYMAMISFNRFDDRGGIYVARRAPGQPGFAKAVQVQADTNIFEDKEYIAVDNSGGERDGTVYVSWTNFDDRLYATAIVVSSSTDHGATWSRPTLVSAAIPSFTGYVQGSVPAVGRDGALYIAWFEDNYAFAPESRWPRLEPQGPPALGQPTLWERWMLLSRQTMPDLLRLSASGAVPNRWPLREARPAASAGPQLRLARSVDGGKSFHVTSIASGILDTPYLAYRTNQFPSLAIAPGNGRFLKQDRLFVCFTNGTRQGDVYVTASDDSGASFSPPVRVNDDGGEAPQFFPWMAVDQLGIVHVVWYDLRNDPSRQLIDLYYAQSTDGGKTFGANQRITPSGFDPFTDFSGGFIGDYNGLTAFGGTAYALWTDTRRGQQDAFYAPLH